MQRFLIVNYSFLGEEAIPMKRFDIPELEVVVFTAEDVITTSGEWGGDGGAED
jgi:hypothetical protein